MKKSDYKLVCGIETHVKLDIEKKLFCNCSTFFGQNINMNSCPICKGLPGTLPVLNKKAVEKAIIAGEAFNCTINKRSAFDRKNYFYPDLPKSYQLTQYYKPLCSNGVVILSGDQNVRIDRIHIEEDAAKIIRKNGELIIDYNRSGWPLIEIVSAPDICSASQAKEYVEKIQTVLQSLGVSECKMHQGEMRCDVNVSIKNIISGEKEEVVEIKNLNSKKFVYKAVEYEFQRQLNIVRKNLKVKKETRGFDESKNQTYSMRQKQNASEYKYFPDPDLPEILTD